MIVMRSRQQYSVMIKSIGFWIWLGFQSSPKQYSILSIKSWICFKFSLHVKGSLWNFHSNLKRENSSLLLPHFLEFSGVQKEERIPQQPPMDGQSQQTSMATVLSWHLTSVPRLLFQSGLPGRCCSAAVRLISPPPAFASLQPGSWTSIFTHRLTLPP